MIFRKQFGDDVNGFLGMMPEDFMLQVRTTTFRTA